MWVLYMYLFYMQFLYAADEGLQYVAEAPCNQWLIDIAKQFTF